MELLSRIQDNWLVLTIPLIAGFIGWLTNVVAVKMMFYPVEPWGKPPWLGWQGVIPANALRLAKHSNELITTKLLSLQQLFDETFDPKNFSGHINDVVDEIVDQIIADVSTKYAKAMWDNAGEVMQAKVRAQVREEVIGVLSKVSADLGEQISDVIDLETTVLEAVGRDRAVMGRMFQDVGAAEFLFIERSGFWFGLLFGIPQMIIWVIFPEWWILPLAGLLVGWFTNLVALRMVFAPQEPKKVGPIVFHGLFHKRQREVAAAFASVVTDHVLNADNLVHTVMNGPGKERLEAIVERRVGELIDRYEAHPMAAMIIAPDQRAALREDILRQIREELPKPGGFFHTFAGEAVNLRGELEARMAALDPESYEGVLRPAFQQDEWKLIAAGAVLGLVAGILQVVYLFGDTMKNLQ